MRHRIIIAVIAGVALSACGQPIDSPSAGRPQLEPSSAPAGGVPALPQQLAGDENSTADQLAQLDRPEQYADLSCRGNAQSDTSSLPLESTSSGVVTLADGSVGIVLIDETNTAHVLGCMSAQTAEVSRSEGLSFVSVAPSTEGVRVLIAVPTGRQLQALAWLDQRGQAVPSPEAGFDVYTFLATEASIERQPELMGPSESQLAAMIKDAGAGTSTVGGLAPDILTSS